MKLVMVINRDLPLGLVANTAAVLGISLSKIYQEDIVGGDIADAVVWIANLPPHYNINTIEMMPVSQSFAGFQVSRHAGPEATP